MPTDEAVDLLVVGAGPAGMAAAAMAGVLGLDCLLVDDKPQPGGQIHAGRLAPQNRRGQMLVAGLRSGKARHRPSCTVWDITPEGVAYVSDGQESQRITARRIILASGALERPWPIPGWTLPGVMAAGGAQLLLKTAGVVPRRPVVLAGSGPLLLLLASQYAAAGVPIAALLDTTPRGNSAAALPLLPGALVSGSLAWTGLWLLARLRAAGTRLVRDVSAVHAEGDGALRSVGWTGAAGTDRIETPLLLLHQGVVPNTQLSRAMRLRHDWNPLLGAWLPHRDSFGATSLDMVAVAGDGAAIMGAVAAEIAGALAGLDAAHRLGRLGLEERDARARPLLRRLARQQRQRSFLDRFFAPPPAGLAAGSSDKDLICRCEAIPAGAIRAAAASGLREINALKSVLRCGMGPCQGRLCEASVRDVLANATGCPPRDLGYWRIRPPIRPIGLEEMAALGDEDLAPEAKIPAPPGVVPRP